MWYNNNMKWTNKQHKLLIELGDKHKDKNWQDIANQINLTFGTKYTQFACSSRYYSTHNKKEIDIDNELTLRQIMRKKSNTEYQRLYRLQNEDHYRAHYRKYNKSKKFKEIRKAYRQKKANDPNFKLANNIRTSVCKLLRSKNNIKSKVLMMTRDQLRKHVENKFDKYLNWDNYGKLWTLKYVTTLESFDLRNEEEFKKACSLDNITIRIK